MGLVINTNVDAINAFTNLDLTNQALSTTISTLSTGLSIQSSKDDPAGFSISTFLQEQIAGNAQARINAQEGVSALQVANGALAEIGNILQILDSLAVSSANSGSTSSFDLGSNQAQYSHYLTQIDQIANVTQFNGIHLLNGSFAVATFQVGPFSRDTITIGIQAATSGALRLVGTSISTSAAASVALASVQGALKILDSLESQVGATQNQLQDLVTDLTSNSDGLTASKSSLVDANLAKALSTFASQSIMLESGSAMLSQAQAEPGFVLSLMQSAIGLGGLHSVGRSGGTTLATTAAQSGAASGSGASGPRSGVGIGTDGSSSGGIHSLGTSGSKQGSGGVGHSSTLF